MEHAPDWYYAGRLVFLGLGTLATVGFLAFWGYKLWKDMDW